MDDPSPGRWPGHAVLQVPVAGLDDFVRSRFEHYDPSLVGRADSAGERFVHAHVTVLGPFDQMPELSAVDALVRQLAPFEAWLSGVDVFPNGVIHCPAEPAADFERWTALARERFPQVEPYRGEFAIAPHVTLDAIGPGVDVGWVSEQVADLLPLRWRADTLDLVWYEQDATRLVARWRP